MQTNQSITKNKTRTSLALVTVLLACCLTVGAAQAASGDSYLENMPRPSGAPNFDFNEGNFNFSDGFNPFNDTGGPGGFMGGNGTFPDGMNGNFTHPDASGGPGDMQPFNGQNGANQATAQADYTLLIAGIAIVAVIILVVVVVLKKCKKNPEEPSTYQAAPPPSTTGVSASS